MGKFSKIIAFVLAFLLVFQAGLSGNFSKIYADELEESFEAAEEIAEDRILEKNEGLDIDAEELEPYKEEKETEKTEKEKGKKEADGIEKIEELKEADEIEKAEKIKETDDIIKTETENTEEIEPKTVIDSNVTLHKDTVYKDLYIQSGSLNLNGYKLEVSGNIIHSGGVLNINGGKLFVKGDYRIQRERETNDGVVYERGSGYLNMTNDEDYVCIDGSLIIESNYTNRLTDGILEIKGDLIQKGSYNTFSPSENHWVILSCRFSF
ncbi:hypothetical protein [Acetivibrio saccincola]|uniref:hypothetical protein n=1 Tax=Acetivibrio saccincola TaxID=1677857 RepID=UPI002B5EC624|nr:hypothetical protein [Acetivibrio saccincola]HQD29595.1 hypothetical protein [Acetivibrio saccincola]